MEDIYPDPAAWEQDLAALPPMGEEMRRTLAGWARKRHWCPASFSMRSSLCGWKGIRLRPYAAGSRQCVARSPVDGERALALLFRLQEMTAFLLPGADGARSRPAPGGG